MPTIEARMERLAKTFPEVEDWLRELRSLREQNSELLVRVAQSNEQLSVLKEQQGETR